MQSEYTLVKPLDHNFDLYRTETDTYEVVPKENGWTCHLNSTLGGNVERAWVYRWGEDTYAFVLNDGEIQKYHFDYWEAMLREIERTTPFDEFEV